jgi:dTDP-4-dehydrorhamnose reductase
MRKHTVLVLGCTSWIGFKLSLKLFEEGFAVNGQSRTINHDMYWLKNQYAINDPNEMERLIESLQPSIIINLLRGEDDNGWDMFRKSVTVPCYYVYLSSSLVLEDYGPDVNLYDELAPKAHSPYGAFKARCELYLKSVQRKHLIVRFNSIHGCTPHKVTRTQSFLEKLQSGANIMVDTGVVQSRLYDEDFISILLTHIKNETFGTLHIASNSATEEIDFLRQLAATFNYSQNTIIPGSKRFLANSLVPSKSMFLNHTPYKLDDEVLLSKLKSDTGLNTYISSGGN